MVATRGDIWLVAPDPTVRSEIRKTRPCVIVSPPEMHDHLRTVIVAPMTTGGTPAPFRVPVVFEGKSGLILLDQLYAMDRHRLLKRLGGAPTNTLGAVLATLQELFAP